MGGALGDSSMALGTVLSNGTVYDAKYHDKISSIISNSSNSYCFYQNFEFSGKHVLLNPHSSWGDLREQGINDMIDSWEPGNCI